MSDTFFGPDAKLGTPELQMSSELGQSVRQHLEQLREHYLNMSWAKRIGFGQRPAVIVVDLALFWTQPEHLMGSNVDSVVEATCRILEVARVADVPIFFSSYSYDPAQLPGLFRRKCLLDRNLHPDVFDLDPRLDHRPNEKIIQKSYASCFKGTNFQQMLAALSVDTLIVTGVSTSHCVYATCRDAFESFRVIVPREAVGERCRAIAP